MQRLESDWDLALYFTQLITYNPEGALKTNVAAKASTGKVSNIYYYYFLVLRVCDKFLGIEEVVQVTKSLGMLLLSLLCRLTK